MPLTRLALLIVPLTKGNKSTTSSSSKLCDEAEENSNRLWLYKQKVKKAGKQDDQSKLKHWGSRSHFFSFSVMSLSSSDSTLLSLQNLVKRVRFFFFCFSFLFACTFLCLFHRIRKRTRKKHGNSSLTLIRSWLCFIFSNRTTLEVAISSISVM